MARRLWHLERVFKCPTKTIAEVHALSGASDGFTFGFKDARKHCSCCTVYSLDGTGNPSLSYWSKYAFGGEQRLSLWPSYCMNFSGGTIWPSGGELLPGIAPSCSENVTCFSDDCLAASMWHGGTPQQIFSSHCWMKKFVWECDSNMRGIDLLWILASTRYVAAEPPPSRENPAADIYTFR